MRATAGMRETASYLLARKKPLLKLGGKKGWRKGKVALHHLKLKLRREREAERRQLRQQRCVCEREKGGREHGSKQKCEVVLYLMNTQLLHSTTSAAQEGKKG